MTFEVFSNLCDSMGPHQETPTMLPTATAHGFIGALNALRTFPSSGGREMSPMSANRYRESDQKAIVNPITLNPALEKCSSIFL